MYLISTTFVFYHILGDDKQQDETESAETQESEWTISHCSTRVGQDWRFTCVPNKRGKKKRFSRSSVVEVFQSGQRASQETPEN